jgi:hypothetical protein
LSVLTAGEVAADARLADPSEMAAWRHYNLTAGLASWQPVEALGRDMRAAYEAAVDSAAVAEEFIRACARAAASPEAVAATELLKRSEGFRVSVSHPDDGREFFPPGR